MTLAELQQLRDDLRTLVEGPTKPTLAIFVEGGCIMAIASDRPEAFANVTVRTIDYDDQGGGTWLVPQSGEARDETVTAHVCDWEIERSEIDLAAIREMTPEEMGATDPSGVVS
jgi:hypothetical protein